MNAIVLTAVLSALNSGLYAASRMLFALTRHGDAPAALAKVNKRGVPVRAILLGTVFGYVSVVMSYVSPDTVFAFLVNSYGTVALFVYVLIAFSQLRRASASTRWPPASCASRCGRIRTSPGSRSSGWSASSSRWRSSPISASRGSVSPASACWSSPTLTRRSRREHLDDSELLAYPPR